MKVRSSVKPICEKCKVIKNRLHSGGISTVEGNGAYR